VALIGCASGALVLAIAMAMRARPSPALRAALLRGAFVVFAALWIAAPPCSTTAS